MTSYSTNTRQGLQEQEYYLPYHWLVRRGAKEVHHKKMALVAELLKRYGPHSGQVLDLGCGDGKNTFDLQEIFGPQLQFTGTDFSERAITYARMLAPHIRFEVQDARHQGFGANSFEAVVSIEVIEHVPVPDVPQFLQEINRMLKSGGTLVLTTPTINRPVDAKHYQHFDEARMRKYLTDAGFEVKEVRGFGKTLPAWVDKCYRYIISLPSCWRLQKHVQGCYLPAAKANCIVVAAIKPQK